MTKNTIREIDDLLPLLKLDSENYLSDSFKGTLTLCKEWISKNDKIYTILLYEDKIVGYINFIPLTKNTYAKFLTGKIIDSDIKYDDVSKFGDSTNCGLFASIVVDKKHRNKQSLSFLFSSFFEKMHKYNIEKFVLTAVSDDGKRVAKKFKNYTFITNDIENNEVYEIFI